MIELIDFGKDYGDFRAVEALNLKIGAGEMFGFIGPNGAGKSTTIRFLATLLKASRGEGIVNGHSVTQNPMAVRQSVGYMPDNFGVYDGMKVWEFLDFFAVAYKIGKGKRKQVISDVLELLDLGHKRDDYVNGLSRGMKQRLCMAKTLVHDPPVLILDEPTSGLDPRARIEVKALFKELKRMGKTILISSHILPELEELCTSVAIVDRGRVLAKGTVSDIERRLRYGAVLRVRVLAEGEQLEAIRTGFQADADVTTATILHDGTIELGFRGDDAASARLLSTSVAAGVPIVTFARAATDLEELFLQVTGQDIDAPGMEVGAA
jgi:ABC-2 type transport system ATP-binding protein